MTAPSILIAGAGPTGLVLAYWLARKGVGFRLISADDGPGKHSRAMAVHARTLEFYRQFGFADEVVAQGVQAPRFHLREVDEDMNVREVGTFEFKELGEGISPYPFMLAYPQDDHERFLTARLAELGIKVEWKTKLAALSEENGKAVATLALPDGGTQIAEFDYVCGCDGAHSQVRHSLGVDFPGAAYEQHFYVADVRIDRGFDPDMWVNLGTKLVALMLPVRSTGMQRLIGLVPPELTDKQDIGFEDVRPRIEPLIGVKVAEVNWFSTYHAHHRVAAHFRKGPAFLLGDAGHIHSPAGGQGMNTGIGDAVNLAWKLASVVQGRADPSLLDTYEPERIAFARTLVATTDRAFQPMVAGGMRGHVMRGFVAPLAFSIMTRFEATRHLAFRTVSQTHIHYGDTPLSLGGAGSVESGDRLPWIGASAEDNFVPLSSLDWQMHVYGTPEKGLPEACAARRLPLHLFAWSKATVDAGFKHDAAYLIRPDGYVGLATPGDAVKKLADYCDRFALTFA